MKVRAGISALVTIAVLAGCASHLPVYRIDALARLSAVKMMGAEKYAPPELASLQQAIVDGDALMQSGEHELADSYYLLAIRKSEAVERSIAREREHERAMQVRSENERLARERQKALEELKRELAEKEKEEKKRIERAPQPVRDKEKEKEVRSFPLHHTVKRGESLPQIAAQPDVYGDAALWPLLYRANRDQIRDPGRIWPGQVLRIPRNISRDDLAEAMRYAQERPAP